jgi:kumamolisin
MPDPPGQPQNAVQSKDLASEAHGLEREELDVKRQELEVRRREANKAEALLDAPWWRRADPLVLALLGAIVTLLGNMIVGHINNVATLQQEREKAANDLNLEQLKAKYNLVLQAIATNEPKAAARNIEFFISSGLLNDSDGKLSSALARFNPVLPSPTGTSPTAPQSVAVAQIVRLYDFPTGLDGTGQTIGLVELDGGYRQDDLDAYFRTVQIPTPAVTAVSVGSANNRPNGEADSQVLLDIEVTGSIAPKSAIRVYFTPNNAGGMAAAIRQAAADQVSVLLIGWGSPESDWKEADLNATNEALQFAATAGVTIVSPAGDRMTSSGTAQDQPDFPASSPWVLAVGGTSLVAQQGHIVTETAWRDAQEATGSGVSGHFSRPVWQSRVSTAMTPRGVAGRSVPDVVATAWNTMPLLRINGAMSAVGGTSVAAAVWAGLIPLINQGLGHNIGYFNPQLYQSIGPAGVMRPVPADAAKSATSAKPTAWNAITGWGSPDGDKLLKWLKSQH